VLFDRYADPAGQAFDVGDQTGAGFGVNRKLDTRSWAAAARCLQRPVGLGRQDASNDRQQSIGQRARLTHLSRGALGERAQLL
jgi:hypothetical protein